MPASEFIVESWKLAMYALLAIGFILNLLHAWHNYDEAMDYAMDMREARMSVVALLNKWCEDGVISSSGATPEDLPMGAAVRLYGADGALIKEVLQAPSPDEGSGVRIRLPVVIDGEEGYMLYEQYFQGG